MHPGLLGRLNEQSPFLGTLADLHIDSSGSNMATGYGRAIV